MFPFNNPPLEVRTFHDIKYTIQAHKNGFCQKKLHKQVNKSSQEKHITKAILVGSKNWHWLIKLVSNMAITGASKHCLVFCTIGSIH